MQVKHILHLPFSYLSMEHKGPAERQLVLTAAHVYHHSLHEGKQASKN